MKRWKTAAACLAAAWMAGGAVRAAELPLPPDLPPTELARDAIDKDPTVVEARRAFSAAGHHAAALRVGPNEWIAKASAQTRRYDGGGRSNEWETGLERTIRIGGKADLDAQLGEVELRIGEARLGEARHEAARALADLWVDALAAVRLRELLSEQRGFAQANQRAAESRRRAGDASALDVNLARADLIEVERQLSAAMTAEARAFAKLKVRFPGLPASGKPLADPVSLDLAQEQWRERVLAESDPLKLAAAQLRKSELNASRASADRVPDPTVGVFAASEANRSERIVGINISIPLSGTYRNERMLQALQEVEAARARLDAQRREIESEVTATYIDAAGSYERWRLASDSLAATRDSARLTQRAYALGEIDLQGLLLARRQALDASVAAEQARVEALRLRHRLLIDGHFIWGLEED